MVQLRRWRQWRRYYYSNNNVNFSVVCRSISSSARILFATVPETSESLEFSDLDYCNTSNNNINNHNNILPTHHKQRDGDDDGTETSPPLDSNISGWMENDNNIVDNNNINNEHAEIIIDSEKEDNESSEGGNENSDDRISSSNIILFHGNKSRPNNNKNEEERGKEGKDSTTTSWNPSDPLRWCKTFGSRSQANSQRLEALVKLRPGDEGYFDVSDIDNIIIDIHDVDVTSTDSTTTATTPSEEKVNFDTDNNNSITIVRTPEQAHIVMAALMKAKSETPQRIYACDTEVMDIDLAEVGPVGNGYVTCLSVYAGPDFDFGLGNKGPGSTLWVDNLDDACGVLQEFKAWLEDEDVLKVWHNYGFDRHVLFNEGINVRGFGGDTMHMARLSDTGRMKYSLESLTEDLLKKRKVPMKEIFGEGNFFSDWM